MELQERLSTIRKALGMTQEQLGRRIGVGGETVAAWESGELIPDAVSIGTLCRELNLSADYVLLGKEPEERAMGAEPMGIGAEEPEYPLPEVCPCCGRAVSGTLCPTCGYPLPMHPPRGPRYAVLISRDGIESAYKRTEALVKYCGFTQEDAEAVVSNYGGQVLRRDLPDAAAQWVAKSLKQTEYPKIVEDLGEPEEDLLRKEQAMEVPASESKGGLGFWGVVGAVIVALLILSFL